MLGGRPRNSLRSDSLGRFPAVCIRAALGPQAYVALATCSTHACHARYDSNLNIKISLGNGLFRANHVHFKLLSLGIQVHPRGW